MAKLKAQLTFRVSEADYDRLQEIAEGERRKMNEVARALLERGLAAYHRDGKLFEPSDDGGYATKPTTIKVPRLTIGEALRQVLTVHRLAEGAAARKRVAELLQIVGLRPEHALRYPHEFSGGQRQRI